MCVQSFPSLDLRFLSEFLYLVSQVSGLPWVSTLRHTVSHSGSLDFCLTQELNFPSNSVRCSIQQKPPFYIIAVRALMASSLRIPSILKHRFFHVCLQVSSLKPFVFYFGPSIHYGPSTFCPSQVLDHPSHRVSWRNDSSAMFILIAALCTYWEGGQETPLSQTHTHDHTDAQNMQGERMA